MNDIILDGLTDTLVITKRFRSPNEFANFIEQMVARYNIQYMEAVIKYCTEMEVDLESVGPLINKKLKEKIQQEAVKANLMKQKDKAVE